MKNLFAALVGILLFTSCQSQSAEGVVSEIAGYMNFGETIDDKNVKSIGEAIDKLSSEAEVPMKIKGVVESVCKKKGCWMNVYSKDKSQSMFVRFKDYGFFMPLDCEGKEVILEGVAFKEVTPIDELQHYAEDEGKSKEEIAAITEPKEEFKFTATGVLMTEE